jgi:hypothetical protein
MTYKIVSGSDVNYVQNQINELLNQGFQPYGNLHVVPTHVGIDPDSPQAKMVTVIYVQALINTKVEANPLCFGKF